MNPIVTVGIWSSGAIVLSALIYAFSAMKQSQVTERISKAVAETKAEVLAIGVRVDGRVEALMDSIRKEGIIAGRIQMRDEITEEAVRVAGVGIEAEKRSK